MLVPHANEHNTVQFSVQCVWCLVVFCALCTVVFSALCMVVFSALCMVHTLRRVKATSGPTNRPNYLLEGYDYPHMATHSYYYPTFRN